MPRATKKRKPWGSNRTAAVEAAAASDGEGIVVGGEPNGTAEPSIGDAIETVRKTLGSFDASTRKRIVRAANTFLK